MAGKSGILSFLGIGSRTKDKDFSFASKVLDAAKGWANLDAAAREKTIGELTGHITHFSEGPEREALIGAMRDSLASPVDALLKEKEVSRIIDGLYNACEQKDEAEAKKTLEAAGIKDAFPPKDKDEKKDKDEDDKDEDDKEKGKAKDAAPFDIDAAIAKAMGNAVGKMTDSISALIDKKVSEALGIKPKSEEKETKTQDSTDDVTLNEETSFLLRGIFGK